MRIDKGEGPESLRQAQEAWTPGDPLNRQHWRSAEVLAPLRAAHQGNCCYCEATPSGFDVEHWRPKGGAKDGLQTHQGYPWLAYTWENLFLACGPCNQRKGSRFALQEPAFRAEHPADDLQGEAPLLLHPQDDWDEHLSWEADLPRAKTERGEHTLQALGLVDNPDLTQARFRHLRQLQVLLEQLGPEPRLLRFFQASARPGAPYHSMVRAWLSREGLA